MRVLVISHNIFSATNNMGKTLAGYFEAWKQEELAQFFVHSEVPTSHICENYFRITDKDIIKSIFTRKCGTVFTKENIEEREDSRIDQGLMKKVYQKAQKRTPLIYIARNFLWRIGHWKNKKFLEWIDEFDPEAIFFASGDYSFIYRIAFEIAEYKNIPLFPVCVDDFYLFNMNKNTILGKLEHRLFMKQVRRVMNRSTALFTICDKMARDYEKLFEKRCYTLHTASSLSGMLPSPKRNKISYLGNLGFGRNATLVDIGRALRSLDIEGKPEYIDVYSAETDPAVLRDLTHENGIEFHGRISADEVKRVMAQSLAVIHTESFEAHYRKRVRYSVSTKIADSLMSGTCILAYGPEDVASMEYLIQNKAAIIATTSEELPQKLRTLLTDCTERKKIVACAQRLAAENHSETKNMNMIAEVMENYQKTMTYGGVRD